MDDDDGIVEDDVGDENVGDAQFRPPLRNQDPAFFGSTFNMGNSSFLLNQIKFVKITQKFRDAMRPWKRPEEGCRKDMNRMLRDSKRNRLRKKRKKEKKDWRIGKGIKKEKDTDRNKEIKKTAPSPQQALSGQGVPRIPGKYAIAEECCRKIQNGPSMVLRLGTLNVGSLTGHSMEIAEMLEHRRIDICCLQEIEWCDLNGHVGEKTDGFDNVHGGFGYGKRNEDGNRILEFAESHGFCLLNTYFRKRLEHLITYKSGPSATQIDFFAVKQPHRRLFKNVKVIPGESCVETNTQKPEAKPQNVPKSRIYRPDDYNPLTGGSSGSSYKPPQRRDNLLSNLVAWVKIEQNA
ncbi:hypothetical protein HELRODRAFT_190766 [Helobdella robusta]|uniref:Endonuclease/exonuclease/phosphatase domain-containing protein n=1 Tax=Helobdella robusta TaxID=6412 RepID=T1FSA0_HELRO|nr:hypothetical protein HELRODRAFT_190766 [Helobdella robusta]ESO08550.1 hypothetical protein HELRODRAFT_190766 [Helobdella robusta]